MKNVVAILIVGSMIGLLVPAAFAQALPAGGSLQDKWEFGVGGSLANSGYVNTFVPGGMVYATYSPIRFFSLDTRAHYIYKSGGEQEFTFTGGYRFNFPIRQLTPYAGGLIGVGHFNDSISSTVGNGRNSFVISYLVGLETPITRHLNLRVIDVEAQVWTGFPANPNSLSPVIYSTGLAYHR